MVTKICLVAVYLLVTVTCDSESTECSYSDVQPMEDFRIGKYLGQWYEIMWRPDFEFPTSWLYEDYSHTYARDSEGNIELTRYYRDPLNRDVCKSDTVRYLFETETEGKLIIGQARETGHDYIIVDTDYDNYAVCYGCVTFDVDGECETFKAWIQSRERDISEENLKKAEEVLKGLCMNLDDLLVTSQNNPCPPSK